MGVDHRSDYGGANSSFTFGASEPGAESYVTVEDGYEACRNCGSYLGKEENGTTDTEDDIGEYMDEEEYRQFTGFTGDEDYKLLKSAYLYARRRFRASTQKIEGVIRYGRSRPRCRCACGCVKRGRRRIPCPTCGASVGRGCCWK